MASTDHLSGQIDHQSRSPSRTRRCDFVVTQSRDGHWTAYDRISRIAHIFSTERAAIHYAIYEAFPGRRDVCALVVPPDFGLRNRAP